MALCKTKQLKNGYMILGKGLLVVLLLNDG